MPPIEDSKQDFSEGDLAALGDTPADDGGEGTGDAKPAEKAAPAEGAKAEPPLAAGGEKAEPAKDGKQTLATGADSEAEDKAKDEKAKPYWPENWREKLAEQIAAGDKKAYARELKRLERIADPAGVYGMYREAEGKLTSGGLIKKPGKDAKPEEIAEYHKALGVPEKPEDYFKEIKLENGAVIGEADKPLVDGFAAAVHKSGATPQFVNAALNWYYANQEEQAAAMDEADDEFRRASSRELKDEYGPAFDRKLNATGSLFAKLARGGLDPNNQSALYNRLLGGRMADGRLIGNDPDFNRFLIALAHEVVPAETLTEGGNQSGMSIDAEIKQIKQRMRDDRRGYDKDEAVQARFRELITAREKIRARG